MDTTVDTTMRVTVRWLLSRRACQKQVELFVATFGDAVDLTAEAVARAAEVGLNLDWLARAMLGPAARAEYERAVDPARTEFARARTDAMVEFSRATAAAMAESARIAEYARASAAAKAEYARASAAAKAEYARAIAPALIAALGLPPLE